MEIEQYLIKYKEAKKVYDHSFERVLKFDEFVQGIDLSPSDLKHMIEYKKAQDRVSKSLDVLNHLNSLVSNDFIQHRETLLWN